MKKITLVLLLFILNYMAFAQCPPGDIAFTSQQEVDDFAANYPNCTEIQGNVDISGEAAEIQNTNISDLSPLNQLTSISGSLQIGKQECDKFAYGNPSLSSLSGLENLTTIGGNLNVEAAAFTDFTGLNGLQSIGGELFIVSTNLINFNGLNNVTSIQSISTCDWYFSCGNIFEIVTIGNTALTSLEGLDNLESIQGVDISCTPSLTMCSVPFVCDIIASGGSVGISGGEGCSNMNEITLGCVSACTEQDSLALVSLYNATDGANWTNTWNLNAPISTWHGVTMSADGCNVQELNLSNNNLVGTIPAEIGELSALTRLILHANGLSGSIPTTIGNLNELRQIWLFSNQLSGTLPAEIGALSQLTHLGIGGNQLMGTIPASYGNLSNLGFFTLKNNQLSGCFDENLLNICTAGNDARINVGNNFDATWTAFCTSGSGVCAPPQPTCRYLDSLVLVQLHQSTNGANWNTTWNLSQPMTTWQGITLNADGCVAEINLNSNNLTGTIPNEIGELTALTRLNMHSNNLSGSIPATIGNLSELRQIWLFKNQLSGTLPSEIGSLIQLSHFGIGVNQLTGTIPASYGDLANLVLFTIPQNQFSGCFDENLTNICDAASNSNINSGNNFDAPWSNFCTTSAGSCQGNYSTTDSLALVAFYYATDGPNWFTTWDLNQPMNTWHGIALNSNRRVVSIELDWNNQDGYIPSEIGDLTELRSLTLLPAYYCEDFPIPNCTVVGSQVGGCLPPEIGNLVNLEVLDVPDNQFCNLPPELGNLSSIQYISMYSNGLSGGIPPELGNLSNLSYLNLYGNGLDGSIPPELGNLSSLRDLILNNNQLSGSIPPELGSLSNLTELLLNNNQLSGNIPPQLGNLSNLINLYLYGNQLSGNIPSELGNLNNLIYLYLHGNQLSGSLPPELGNLSNVQYLWLNRNQLSGNIPPELGNLSNLYRLYLDNNQLSGSLPPELGNLTNLYRFQVHYNQLSGCFDDNLLNICPIGGDILINIGNNFDASWNDFCVNGTGSCSSPPASCTYADSLALTDFYNATNGTDWTNTWDFSLPMNTWYGVTLNADGCVTELNLSNNNLSGTIPVSIAYFANLERLNLHTNNLSGSLPSTIGDLSELRQLWLFSNQLSGTLPSEIGNLTNLTHLGIGGNQFIGSIPASYGNLSNLGFLALKNNNLSGCYDANLANICAAGNDSRVSSGNNFAASWSSFCTSASGCCNCRLDMSDNSIEPDENLIHLYPNPANQFINIDMQTKNDDELNYAIYNALGEMMQSGQIQSQAGSHQYPIELDELNTGVYYFSFMIGSQRVTKNFTVIR